VSDLKSYVYHGRPLDRRTPRRSAHRPHRTFLALALVASVPSMPAAANIKFNLDYTYDTNGFFSAHPQAKAALTLAAQNFSDRIRDSLIAIPPGGGTWTAIFGDPGGGPNKEIDDLEVPQDTVTVFAGGYPGGIGGPGGYRTFGVPSFYEAIVSRGQAGALAKPATDFGPWGGCAIFPSEINWSFALGAAPAKSQFDFYSFAIDQFAWVLGFGYADSWKSRVTNGVFHGPTAGVIAVAPSGIQWVSGTKGVVGTALQEAAMTPSLMPGVRLRFSSTDWAGMADLGWSLARPGDANADGRIDFTDLVALAQNYNISDGRRRWAQGDFNFDGNVDFNDLVILAQNYNTTLPSAPLDLGTTQFQVDFAGAITHLPEPGGLAAIGLMLRSIGLRPQRRGRGPCHLRRH